MVITVQEVATTLKEGFQLSAVYDRISRAAKALKQGFSARFPIIL